MSNALMTVEDQGEKTLMAFVKQVAADLSGDEHEALNELARALAERGWFHPLPKIKEKVADHTSAERTEAAITSLIHKRMLEVDADAVTGLLGFLSVPRTDHRAHLDNGVDVFCHGGMDLLAVAPMLLKSAKIFTKCGQTGVPIKLQITDDQIVESNVEGLAGFQATWDGKSSLQEIAKNSPLFAGDEALEAWQAANPDVDGTALPADLMLWIGMGAAQAMGHARFKLIGHSEG